MTEMDVCVKNLIDTLTRMHELSVKHPVSEFLDDLKISGKVSVELPIFTLNTYFLALNYSGSDPLVIIALPNKYALGAVNTDNNSTYLINFKGASCREERSVFIPTVEDVSELKRCSLDGATITIKKYKEGS